MAKDPANAHFSTAALAEMAGFRSRTTFYSAFKSKTGMLPSEYMKSLKR